MQARAPKSLPGEEAAFQKLGKDLGSATSPMAINGHLKALVAGLQDRQRADRRALQFLRAGGLPPLIRHLRGAEASQLTPDPDGQASTISATAALAMCELLRSESAVLQELKRARGILLPLFEALCDAPYMRGRSAAAETLGLLARAQPDLCRVMVEMNVFKVVFVLFKAEDPMWMSILRRQAAGLVCELLCSKLVSARELERVIREPGIGPTFSALVLLQDCLMDRKDDILGTVVDAGVVKAMVATLEHESPFCVAAAAGALGFVAQAPGSRGQALLEASGAVPALVRVLRRPPPPGHPGLFPDATFRIVATSQGEPIRFHDPIPVVVASLSAVPHNNRMLDSFLEAGGVPAILRLLRKSTCPAALGYNLDLITSLVSPSPIRPPRSPDRACDLAIEFHRAGISEAALEAFQKQPKAARGRLLQMLFAFFAALSQTFLSEALYNDDAHAAMAVLVRGDVVELAVNYMAEAPVDTLGSGVGLLLVMANDPKGKQRLGDQKLVDLLIKGLSKWLREGHWDCRRLFTSKLLMMLSEVSPGFIRAAIEANLTPDIIRFLREVCPNPQATAETSEEVSDTLESTLRCLGMLLTCDAAKQGGACKSALDAGLVTPLLIDLLNLREDLPLMGALRVIIDLVGAGPRDEIQRWAGCLPRAVAGLLRATPPLQPALAANALFCMGMVDRSVMLAYSSWGIENTLKQLTKHSDPDTASAACRLLILATEGVGEGEVLSEAVLRCLSPGVETEHLSSRQSTAHSPVTTSPSANPLQDPQTMGPASQPAQNPSGTSTLDPTQRQHNSRAGSRAKRVEERRSAPPNPRSPGEGTSRVGASAGCHLDNDPGCRMNASPGEGTSGMGASPGHPVGASSGEGTGGGDATPRRRVGRSPGRRLADPWACAHCKITDEALQSGKLKECSGCRLVRYCGGTCQKAHWRVHKATCKRVQAARS